MGVDAGMGMMLVSGAQAAMGVGQAYQQGQVLRQNAQIEEANIPYIRQQAFEQARQLQVGSLVTLGRQRTGYAKGGLAQGGSVFDVMQDTATNFNRDANLALLQGELQARAAQRRADLYRFQARTGMFDAIGGGLLGMAGTGAYAQSLKPAQSDPQPFVLTSAYGQVGNYTPSLYPSRGFSQTDRMLSGSGF